MKNKLIAVLLLALTALFSSSLCAEPESALEQLKDAQDSSQKAADAPTPEEAKAQAGGQFDQDHDRPKDTPEPADVPEPGAPQRVEP